MRLKINTLLLLFTGSFIVLFSSCGMRREKRSEGREIVVTVAPLAGLVEEIVGDDYDITVLLPSGSAPESYSPTPRQITSIEGAEMVFMLGTMDFEHQIIKRFENQLNNIFIDVSKGIHLIDGSCNHGHSHKEVECNECEDDYRHDCHEGSECDECGGGDREHNHSHTKGTGEHNHAGIDPHIWLSPNTLQVIVDNIAQEIIAANPDSTKYGANYEQLKAKLQRRKERYREVLITAPRAFLIYHPALGYLAEEYGLEQISLENEGKSPTPAALAEIVDRVKAEGIESMIYQQEYPLDVVQPIAEILGVNLIEINPLSKDVITELDHIIEAITNSNGE